MSRWKKPPAPTPQIGLPLPVARASVPVIPTRHAVTDTSIAAHRSVEEDAGRDDATFSKGMGDAGGLAAAMMGTLRKVQARQALRSVALAATVRGEVLDKLRELGAEGATADELAQHLRRSPFTTRPRCTELCSFGQIKDSGRRRKNASGRNAIVWVIG